MIAVEWGNPQMIGITAEESAALRAFDPIRQADIASLRRFVEQNRAYLSGRVLDFGAGRPGTCRQPEPYRDLVDGEYVAFDKGDPEPRGEFDAVLSTQVLQYLPDPMAQIRELARKLKPGGHLVLAYPTNWDECEDVDLWRFTKAGMESMLKAAGLFVLRHDRRATVALEKFRFPLGYGVVARKPARRAKLSEEESAATLTAKLRAREPFLFLRYGDGALECINDLGRGHTCDGEEYSRELGAALKSTWDSVIHSPSVCVGDWLSASFTERDTQYGPEYEALIGNSRPEWLHFEALLFMRTRHASRELARFYSAVQSDPRRKLLLAPAAMAPLASRLGADHLVTPLRGMFEAVKEITAALDRREFDILLWGCGMAGALPVIECRRRYPGRTYINIGSAFDPMYLGQTRSRQMKAQHIKAVLGW